MEPTILFVVVINAAVRTSKQISRSAFPRSKASQKGGLTRKRKAMTFSALVFVFRNFRVRFRMKNPTIMIIPGARNAGLRNRSMI
jgi:hypothetical protein